MINSNLVRLWDGKQDLPCLKSIILSNSKNLTKLPDSTGIPNLEMLRLTFCTGLVEIHPSIAVHKKLKHLYLPSAIICKLKSLKKLHMRGCSKLEKLMENAGEMECLEELWISETAMKKLKRLRFRGSPVIRKHDVGFGRLLGTKSPAPLGLALPSLRALCSLVELNLSEGDITDDIGGLSSLRCLDLSGNNFVTLPASIQCLFKVRSIILNRCGRLQQLPHLPSNRDLRVSVDNCASLKMLSEPSKLNKPINLEAGAEPEFITGEGQDIYTN